MTVEVGTSQYEFAHGKRPRGRGQWAFIMCGQTMFAPGGQQTYAEAKKWAQHAAAEFKASRVEVAP